MEPYSFDRSQALFERAKKVIPGGIYGHQTPRMLVMGSYPYFFERGEGSHVWDVDGNEYIDYVMALGAMILGHKDSDVTRAVTPRTGTMNSGSRAHHAQEAPRPSISTRCSLTSWLDSPMSPTSLASSSR